MDSHDSAGLTCDGNGVIGLDGSCLECSGCLGVADCDIVCPLEVSDRSGDPRQDDAVGCCDGLLCIEYRAFQLHITLVGDDSGAEEASGIVKDGCGFDGTLEDRFCRGQLAAELDDITECGVDGCQVTAEDDSTVEDSTIHGHVAGNPDGSGYGCILRIQGNCSDIAVDHNIVILVSCHGNGIAGFDITCFKFGLGLGIVDRDIGNGRQVSHRSRDIIHEDASAGCDSCGCIEYGTGKIHIARGGDRSLECAFGTDHGSGFDLTVEEGSCRVQCALELHAVLEFRINRSQVSGCERHGTRYRCIDGIQ